MIGQEARDDERETLQAWLNGEPYEVSCRRNGTPVETTTATDPALAFVDGYQMAVAHVRAILAAGYRKHPEPEITEYRNVLSDGEEIISFHRSRFSVEKRRAAGPWAPVGEGEQ